MSAGDRNGGVANTVKAEVRLAHVHSNGPDGDYLSIEFEDEVSGTRFLTAKIAFDQVSRFFLQREVPTTVELQGLELLGCTREVKQEFVPRVVHPRRWDQRDTDAQEAVSPLEVDGWNGSTSDYGNSHRFSKKEGVEGYSVAFVRFVRPDGTPVL